MPVVLCSRELPQYLPMNGNTQYLSVSDWLRLLRVVSQDSDMLYHIPEFPSFLILSDIALQECLTSCSLFRRWVTGAVSLLSLVNTDAVLVSVKPLFVSLLESSTSVQMENLWTTQCCDFYNRSPQAHVLKACFWAWLYWEGILVTFFLVWYNTVTKASLF